MRIGVDELGHRIGLRGRAAGGDGLFAAALHPGNRWRRPGGRAGAAASRHDTTSAPAASKLDGGSRSVALHVDCLRVEVGPGGAPLCATPATNSAPDTPHACLSGMISSPRWRHMSTFTAIEAARKQTSGERNANKYHLDWSAADDRRDGRAAANRVSSRILLILTRKIMPSLGGLRFATIPPRSAREKLEPGRMLLTWR